MTNIEDAETGAPDELLEPLPVLGYAPQPQDRVAFVNRNKVDEEITLRLLDVCMKSNAEHFAAVRAGQKSGEELPPFDGRWLAIAREHFEQAYMALNRAIFQPQRIRMPEDAQKE